MVGRHPLKVTYNNYYTKALVSLRLISKFVFQDLGSSLKYFSESQEMYRPSSMGYGNYETR
jgi:hypothetical protein